MGERWLCGICGKSFARRHDIERPDDGHLVRFHSGNGMAVTQDEYENPTSSVVFPFPSSVFRFDSNRSKKDSGPDSTIQGKTNQDGRDMSDRVFQKFNEGTEEFLAKLMVEQFKNGLRPGLSFDVPHYLTTIPYNRVEESVNDIFGYESHHCSRCGCWEPLERCFTSVGFRLSRDHICPDPRNPSPISRYAIKMSADGRLPAFKEFVKRWHTWRNEPPLIHGFRIVSQPASEMHQDPQKKDHLSLVLTNPDNPQQQIRLSCDPKDCIKRPWPTDKKHWQSRVLSETTRLNPNELNEFLDMFPNATFGFVNFQASDDAQITGNSIKGKPDNEIYVIALTSKLWDMPALLLRLKGRQIQNPQLYPETGLEVSCSTVQERKYIQPIDVRPESRVFNLFFEQKASYWEA